MPTKACQIYLQETKSHAKKHKADRCGNLHGDPVRFDTSQQRDIERPAKKGQESDGKND
jgi:hypothetical protein